MNRIFALAILMLMPITFGRLYAQDRTRTFVDRVTGGSLTVTNTDETAAYELKHVSFTLDTNWTNTFAISEGVRYKLPDLKLTAITTNTWLSSTDFGYIETNTQWYAQGYADRTNTCTVAITTNVQTTQFYDVDNFPKGWSWEPNNVQVFSFTATNAIDLIRVYDVYPRP